MARRRFSGAARGVQAKTRFGVFLAVLVVLAAACSGGASPSASSSSEVPNAAAASAEPAPEADATPTTPSTQAVVGVPGVAALSTGRGDDGSLEVGIWFGSDPFAGGTARIRVGTDSDDSYPGVGDPSPHIDDWLEIGPDGLVLFEAGSVVAGEATGGIDSLVSWTGRGAAEFIYFIGSVPVRAGTLWVVVEVGGAIPAGGVAGVPVGESCSFHGTGIDLGQVPGDVPNAGVACRYPQG